MQIHSSLLRIIAVISLISLTVSTLSGCKKQYEEKTSFAMGSVLTAKILTDDKELSDKIFSGMNTVAAATEKALSATKEDAEIYKLNKEHFIKSSDYLTKVMQSIITVCNLLDRRVDISIGNVTSLWGFSSDSPCLPSDEKIKAAAGAVDLEKILIDPENKTITKEEDISIDLGAVGKGAACDEILSSVSHHDVPFIVNLGGTILAYGEGPTDGKWSVAVRNPFSDANSYFATLELKPAAPKNAIFVSTSGSYEKCFEENGKKYHHILDPETGYPVETELVSVTVVANSGLAADALSTAVFIEGFNKDSMDHLRLFDAEAVFVFSDSTYYVTEGLKNSIEINDKSFTAREYEAE